MADLEEAPVAAFKSVYVDANVAGCWFHYAQAVTKRVQKISLRDAYHTDAEVGDTVPCAAYLGSFYCHLLAYLRLLTTWK